MGEGSGLFPELASTYTQKHYCATVTTYIQLHSIKAQHNSQHHHLCKTAPKPEIDALF